MLLRCSSSALLLLEDWIKYRIVRNAHEVGNFRATLKSLRDMMFVVHVMALDSDADKSHPQAHVAAFDPAKEENLTRECSGRGIPQFPNRIGYASGLVECLGFRRYMGPRDGTD